jgi:hypothetical protein
LSFAVHSITFNASETRPSCYVSFAANARAQGHGTLSRSARTQRRQGNVGIPVM